MPRYFFHLPERHAYAIPRGADFPDSLAAKRHAEYMASHLGDIDPWGYIVVTDEMGVPVARCRAEDRRNDPAVRARVLVNSD